jgi:hypothetical protein
MRRDRDLAVLGQAVIVVECLHVIKFSLVVFEHRLVVFERHAVICEFEA